MSAALRGLGESDQALAHAHTAMTLASQHGFRLHEGHAHATLARNYLQAGRYGPAAEHATQALAVYLQTGHRLGQARAHDLLGQAIQHSDGDDKAQPHWQAALDLYEEIGAPGATKLRERLGILTH
jgi:tetratricopeptide (TPR) repeat protein